MLWRKITKGYYLIGAHEENVGMFSKLCTDLNRLT